MCAERKKCQTCFPLARAEISADHGRRKDQYGSRASWVWRSDNTAKAKASTALAIAQKIMDIPTHAISVYRQVE